MPMLTRAGGRTLYFDDGSALDLPTCYEDWCLEGSTWLKVWLRRGHVERHCRLWFGQSRESVERSLGRTIDDANRL